MAMRCTLYLRYKKYTCLRWSSCIGQRSEAGWIFKAQQLITVDRKDPNSRHQVKAMIKTRSQPNSDWPQQTLIFPEATCTNGTTSNGI